jgi:hypothetical protein
MSDAIEKLAKMMSDLNRHVDKIRNGTGVWCSFCGKDKGEVEMMLDSPVPEIKICNECVDKAYAIIHTQHTD